MCVRAWSSQSWWEILFQYAQVLAVVAVLMEKYKNCLSHWKLYESHV